jgi:uncharacterized caspase-like protein
VIGGRAFAALGAALLAAVAPATAGARGLVPVDVDPAQLDESFGPRKIALVIGLGEYEDPLFTPLSYARADAEAMARTLADPEYGGYDVVQLVTAAEDTGLSEVRSLIDEVLAAAGPDDDLLVYLSGHGTLDLDWQGVPDLFLAVRDTRKEDLPDTALRVRELQDALADSRAGRKVLILDACHHGAGKSSVPAETLLRLRGLKGPARPLLRKPEAGYEAHLFASTFGLPALEDESLGHGVYTWYLLQAMRERQAEADRDGDGLVSVSEAHDFARDSTIEHTAAVQVPRAEYRIVGREQIFLSGDAGRRRQAEQAMLFTYDDFYGQCSVEVDGETAGLLPRGIALEPGNHEVVVRTPSGQVLAQRTVRMTAGQAVSVESLVQGFPRFQVGVSGGALVAMAPAVKSPYGGALGGVQIHGGFSFPGHKAVRGHLRFDLGYHAGRHAVQAQTDQAPLIYEADVHALDGGVALGVHLRARRFGLVAAPRVGFGTAFRPSRSEASPARPNLVFFEPGLVVEPSISITDRLAVVVGWTGTVTVADLTGHGQVPIVMYSRVHGGVSVTW